MYFYFSVYIILKLGLNLVFFLDCNQTAFSSVRIWCVYALWCDFICFYFSHVVFNFVLA